jgi:hypothetical protein
VNGVEKSQDLLNMILKFWRENIGLVDPKKSTFPQDRVIPLLEKLVKIKSREKELKSVDLYFSMFQDEKKEEHAKQAFWLNIFNYMTLFRFAEIFLIQPKLIKELTSYAMWQSLWLNNFFYIKGARIS